MEALKDILWPIVVVGGIGAFIDFLIGRKGQEKTKDFLLKWWVRFDDVRWKNFGRKEGFFAGNLIERWFGRKTWSLRRILAGLVFLTGLMGCNYFSCQVMTLTDSMHFNSLFGNESAYEQFFGGRTLYKISVEVIITIVGFCVAVSFTTLVTLRMAHLCGNSEVKNLTIFLLMLVVNYILLIVWLPVTDGMKNFSLTFIFDYDERQKWLDAVSRRKEIPQEYEIHFIFFLMLVSKMVLAVVNSFVTIYPSNVTRIVDYFGSNRSVDHFSFSVLAMPLFPSLFRFALSILFVGSFLLRPFIMRPVSLVWVRIVESDKPVFTVIFGGAAAIASAVSEVAKHL